MEFEILTLDPSYFSKVLNILLPPNSATFNVTENCNSKCLTCNQWKKKSSNELSLEEITDVLYQLKELKFQSIGIAGGEPFLRKDLLDIISSIHDIGFDSISLVTNGLLINEKNARNILAAGLDDIKISIEGDSDTHDYLRGKKGFYSRTIYSLKILSELIRNEFSEVKLTILLTLMKPTLGQIEHVLSLTKKYNACLGFNLLDTKPYFFRGVDVSDWIITDEKKLENTLDELLRLRNKYSKYFSKSVTYESIKYAINKLTKNTNFEYVPCYMGFLHLYFDAHGNIYSGCWVLPPIGNIRDKKIKEILDSSEYKKRILKMLKRNCPNCTCGYNENIIYHFPSLLKEIKWNIKGIFK